MNEKGETQNFKVCFLKDKKYTIGVFELDKRGFAVRTKDGKGVQVEFVPDVNAEEFLDIITDIQDTHPQKPPILELIHLNYRDVCPMSLIDNSYSQIMVWETFSQEYGGYPFADGTLGEQPNKLIDAYLSILFSRNEYYRIREEKTKQKMSANDRKANSSSATAGMRR